MNVMLAGLLVYGGYAFTTATLEFYKKTVNELGMWAMTPPVQPTLITVRNTVAGAKEYHIRFNTEFTNPEQYQHALEVLVSADERDTIIVYLAGNGGAVDTVIQLINGLRESLANVKVVIEGPVYSGHAYLATAGRSLQALPNAYLMFHHSSGLNNPSLCADAKGQKDRGQDAFAKCEQSQKFHLANTDKLLDEIESKGLLTAEEVKNLKAGFDVYISAEEINSRAAANHRGG